MNNPNLESLDPALQVTRIRPSRGWVSLKLDELWEYHELLYFLVWRDIKVRYKQTVLGSAWAILQPFMTMVVFSLFFGKLGKIPTEGLPSSSEQSVSKSKPRFSSLDLRYRW